MSQLDVENSLRFDNKLMAFDTTAAGPAQGDPGDGVAPASANKGGFPQIGGVRFSSIRTCRTWPRRLAHPRTSR